MPTPCSGGPFAEGLLPLRLPQGKFLFKFHWMVFRLRKLRPRPSRPSFFHCNKKTEQLIRHWADEHYLTVEQLVRAFLYYIVRYELDTWRKAGGGKYTVGA